MQKHKTTSIRELPTAPHTIYDFDLVWSWSIFREAGRSSTCDVYHCRDCTSNEIKNSWIIQILTLNLEIKILWKGERQSNWNQVRGEVSNDKL